ncbi:MAG: energy-coupling factor transporter ATPase [Caldilinea sp.]|nr:energy-coupling factor transporter ATPase [Caldilinea sp.]MDW8441224.1 energy-coupling factor transporter ATPase [Caldilineaceae bacterium]
MAPLIRIESLHYTYQHEGGAVQALRGIDLTIEQGEYVVLLGHNGSGKSTLAKHLNALLLPTQGDVWINGWNTKERRHLREIRSTVGMVFQQPDNQIVATIVEEDVAFGPENLGLERQEIRRRVEWSLERVDMLPFRHRAPHLLSGGQKQRVCIAGVLAMQPSVLVLDEATAMLDPIGRQEVLEVARRLNREEGVTIIAVTHFMREAIEADRVLVLHDGKIALQGPPRTLFQQIDRLRALSLDVPHVSELAQALHRRFPAFPPDLLTPQEIAAAVIACCEERREESGERSARKDERGERNRTRDKFTLLTPHSSRPPLLALHHVAHYYMRGTPLEVKAIEDVNIEVHRGEIIGVIGHTGSGKSTAVQHFNGLLKAHEGEVWVLGQNLADPAVDLRAVRRAVGLVFQTPEAQLFEQYVGDDVAYGPRKQGLGPEEVRARVRRAMEAVGLPFEEFKDRITFSLSGGQMRRVAIAGVLALEPQVLVLDEPTAGLDPQARRQLMRHILDLHRQGVTLVIISHNMEELAEICDRIYVIADGRTVMAGTPAEVFSRAAELRAIGLDAPDMTQVAEALKAQGLLPADAVIYTLEQAEAAIAELLLAHGAALVEAPVGEQTR